jgi:hypothetical protein
MIENNLNNELHQLDVETFEIEDISDVGMDAPAVMAAGEIEVAVASTSTSSCCSTSTSSCCSTCSSCSSTFG